MFRIDTYTVKDKLKYYQKKLFNVKELQKRKYLGMLISLLADILIALVRKTSVYKIDTDANKNETTTINIIIFYYVYVILHYNVIFLHVYTKWHLAGFYV